ncbi:MAG: hypothetical protein OJF50_000900 [Nitrospira sp.]|nr:hypothetical protein [Nitrospira sp.]
MRVPSFFMAKSLIVSRLSAFDLLCYRSESDRVPGDRHGRELVRRW